MTGDVSALSTTVISHSSSIKSLEEKMGLLAALVYSNPNEELVGSINENPMNAIQVSAIVTLSRRTLKEIMRSKNVYVKRVVANNEPPKEKIEAPTKEVEGGFELNVKNGDDAAPTMVPKSK